MALILTGCGSKQECVPNVQYVTEVQEVYVEVACVVAKADCGVLSGSLGSKLIQALECVAKQNKEQEVCNGKW